jgi:hypothetical protein
MAKIDTEIKKLKYRLLCKAQKSGLYENFGDKEFRNLSDKHKINPYGNPEEREVAEKILDFSKWARHVGDGEVKGEKC